MTRYLLVSVGPDGSEELRGSYASKSAASRQMNRDLRDAQTHGDWLVYHNGKQYKQSEISYRVLDDSGPMGALRERISHELPDAEDTDRWPLRGGK